MRLWKAAKSLIFGLVASGAACACYDEKTHKKLIDDVLYAYMSNQQKRGGIVQSTYDIACHMLGVSLSAANNCHCLRDVLEVENVQTCVCLWTHEKYLFS